jgi:hypothetical protein
MNFSNTREAKEFLVARIVEQALREGTPLPVRELQILHFCESEQSSVPEQADDTWDDDAYEQKVARLIKNCDRRIRSEGTQEDHDAWLAAIDRIRRTDDYIGVMISRAGLRPRSDLLRLAGTGVAVSGMLLILVFLSVKFDIDSPSREAVGFYVWATLGGLALLYFLLLLVLGAKTFGSIFDRIFAVMSPIPRTKK